VKATLLQNLEGTPEQSGSGEPRKRVSALLRLSHRLDPYRPALHYRIGSFWIALGEREEARDALAVALTDSFHYARPVFDLLWSSVENVAELQDFVGDRPLSLALLGDFLWMHGYRKEAEEQFQKVEAARVLDYRTGEALIAHYIREYQGEKARKVIRRMESDPHLSLFYQSRLKYFQGKSFLQEKRFQEAIIAYERSLALDPSVIQSHLELAEAYLEEGQPQKAIARWHYVLSRGISVPREVAGPGDIHFGLGRAYEALGDRDRALAEYLRASSEDPGNVDFSRKASEVTKGL
jgi:tetratricopeptide (TPR) repeat protein